MQNFLKISILSCALAGICVPATGQDSYADDGAITVRASESHVTFVNSVAKSLDRELNRLSLPMQQRFGMSGYARVRFVTGDDGTARNVELYDRRGGSWVETAALRAVGRMKNLSAAPVPGQLVQANIIFANSDAQADGIERKLQEAEAIRIASARADDPPVLALNFSPRPRS